MLILLSTGEHDTFLAPHCGLPAPWNSVLLNAYYLEPKFESIKSIMFRNSSDLWRSSNLQVHIWTVRPRTCSILASCLPCCKDEEEELQPDAVCKPEVEPWEGWPRIVFIDVS